MDTPQIYIIAPTSREASELEKQVNTETATVMKPPKKDIHVARKPRDDEIIIDLRKEPMQQAADL